MNLKSENLSFFRNNFYSIYQEIINFDTNKQNNISSDTINILENFFKNPSAFYVTPKKFTLDYSIKENEEHIHKIHNNFMEKLERNIPNQEHDTKKYHVHLDSIPVLIIFGIEDGLHIKALLESIDVKSLIIVDKDYTGLKRSINEIEWQSIINYFQRDNYSLEIRISDSVTDLAHIILNEIDQKYLHFSYYIPYIASNNEAFFIHIINQIVNKYHLLHYSWGFYDDGRLGLSNSLKNIQSNINYLNIMKPIQNNLSAFIIGSGPSLDNDIQYIKEHQNNVIIFSCGTGLKVLEKHSIIPDFHIEIERTDFITKVLTTTTEETFKKGIDFLGLSVIDNDVFKLFKTRTMFFKKIDTVNSLIPNQLMSLDYIGPTVVNAGVSIVSSLGFDNVFLFGTDMGFKDEKKHHSKDSAYHSKGTLKNYWNPKSHHITLPANFNREENIYSVATYIDCKRNVEIAIRNFRNINYYNCSDGAYIEGTTPLKSRNIQIVSNNKTNILNQIKSNIHTTNDTFQQQIYNKKHLEYTSFIQKTNLCLQILSQPITSYSEFFNLSNTINKLFPEIKQKEQCDLFYSLLKGDMDRMFLTIYTHSLMSKNIKEAFDFINQSLNTIQEFLQYIKRDITILLDVSTK